MLSSLFRRVMSAQLLTYALVGGAGTAVHYVAMLIAVELFDLLLAVATTIGFVLGAIVNYSLNYIYTFKSQQAHSKTAPKFFFVAFIGMLLNGLILSLLVQVPLLETYYMAAQIITTLAVMLLTFKLNKIWTF